MSEPAQALYRSSGESVRASFGDGADQALAYYQDLMLFTGACTPPSTEAPFPTILDVGCGSGWSTYAFARAGYDATGVDLNPEAFEPPAHERCRLKVGSATALPFGDAGFDAVVCYQCLEHVPDPRRALDEMIRVCRPGGVVSIVGPNLVSPFPGLAYLARPSSWRTTPFLRRPGMARHPYGNTVPEIVGAAIWRSLQIAGKVLSPAPRLLMREPDLRPPFHADNDACYLCNPTDLIRYFRSKGLSILRRGKPGRSPLTYLIAGGTWVAARKPGA